MFVQMRQAPCIRWLQTSEPDGGARGCFRFSSEKGKAKPPPPKMDIPKRGKSPSEVLIGQSRRFVGKIDHR